MASYEKLDFWSRKAQKEGYPARSVYKLMEIDKKFGLLGKTLPGQNRPRILELGAAPGSWSLYILRRFGPVRPASPAHPSSPPGPPNAANQADVSAAMEESVPLLLAAADLQSLSRRFDKGLFDRKDFFFIQGDFGSAELRTALSGRGPYTVLLSDAAPATTGNRGVDASRSLDLAEQVLAYADSVLAPGGNLAMKIFQGAGAEDLPARMRERFAGVRTFKPKACRSDSFEIYFLGLGKKQS
jgi:23S rRNA (uridine2552-2'-O)-methyltransferase